MLLQRLIDLWRAHQRRIDIKILWPACKHQTPSLHHAKAAFALHAFNDKAWQALGKQGIHDAIEKLK